MFFMYSRKNVLQQKLTETHNIIYEHTNILLILFKIKNLKRNVHFNLYFILLIVSFANCLLFLNLLAIYLSFNMF